MRLRLGGLSSPRIASTAAASPAGTWMLPSRTRYTSPSRVFCTSLTPNACCIAAIVPVSLMVRRSGFGVSLSTVSPNSLAKARTILMAVGSAACFWRYWARVSRSLPSRLVLRGLLRLTMTETVMTLAGRTGVSPVAAERGAFSLPGNTTRCWEEKRGADFLAGIGSSPVKHDAHNIPVFPPREVSTGMVKVTFTQSSSLAPFHLSRQSDDWPLNLGRPPVLAAVE